MSSGANARVAAFGHEYKLLGTLILHVYSEIDPLEIYFEAINPDVYLSNVELFFDLCDEDGSHLGLLELSEEAIRENVRRSFHQRQIAQGDISEHHIGAITKLICEICENAKPFHPIIKKEILVTT